ncbi:glycosyltransferase [Mangrovihabitans endophyticus]|uniref:Glycosyl transferase n=1 Tax=Mangrovihabitans endophyticus TaxID=1751298 RepID=A0A8J3FSH2_9ACTN|nr:glycosyltransferase [Mangrovihabitans endophyticus]GGL19537.1 glycosyl transferase [Mangrovihabitans endophyticus]
MRIAMVHASFSVRGGAENYLDDLAAALVDRGHQVRVFTAADRPRWSARLPGKAAVHLGDLLDPTGLRPRDLRVFRPDVVHVHNWQGLGVLPVARLARAYPTVHTVHDYAVVDPNNAMLSLGRSGLLDATLRLRSAWILRRFAAVSLIYATPRARAAVVRSAPRTRQPRSRIVPLAVAGHRATADLPPGDPGTFLYLGALGVHKGVDLLLEAWDSPGTLLVAGDGPLRDEVRRAAAASGGSVIYLGPLDADGKRAAFGRAGWLVFPSRHVETYGLVCAEALIAGRPVIAGAHAPPPMAGEKSVLLYHGVDGLRATLRRAAGMSPDEYAAVAAAAAADGRELDWDAHVGAVLDAYRSR